MWVKDCACGPCEEKQGGESDGDGDGSEVDGSERSWGRRWEVIKSQQPMGGDIDGDEL